MNQLRALKETMALLIKGRKLHLSKHLFLPWYPAQTHYCTLQVYPRVWYTLSYDKNKLTMSKRHCYFFHQIHKTAVLLLGKGHTIPKSTPWPVRWHWVLSSIIVGHAQNQLKRLSTLGQWFSMFFFISWNTKIDKAEYAWRGGSYLPNGLTNKWFPKFPWHTCGPFTAHQMEITVKIIVNELRFRSLLKKKTNMLRSFISQIGTGTSWGTIQDLKKL